MQQLIRSLQLVVHLPLFKITFPAAAILFMRNVIEVAMYDVLGLNNLNFERLFNYDQKINQIYEEEQVQQIQNIGYETPVAIQNLGSIATVIVFYFFMVFIFALVSGLSNFNFFKRLIPVKNYLRKTLFFNEILMILIDRHFEILITTHIELSSYNFEEQNR